MRCATFDTSAVGEIREIGSAERVAIYRRLNARVFCAAAHELAIKTAPFIT